MTPAAASEVQLITFSILTNIGIDTGIDTYESAYQTTQEQIRSYLQDNKAITAAVESVDSGHHYCLLGSPRTPSTPRHRLAWLDPPLRPRVTASTAVRVISYPPG